MQPNDAYKAARYWDEVRKIVGGGKTDAQILEAIREKFPPATSLPPFCPECRTYITDPAQHGYLRCYFGG